MIEVRGLCHRFGLMKVALDEVSFDVPEGSVCAVLGRNGSGKTTLLRILAGVLPPQRAGRLGWASVCDVDPDEDAVGVRRVSGFLSAAAPVDLSHRVRDLVDLHSRVYPGLSAARILGRLREQSVDVGDQLKALSRGGLRRVLATLVMERDPQVLFLDEPTDGLDPEAAETLLQQIRDRALRANRCTLVATHRPEDVERVCDRVVLLRAGRVLLEGDLDELKDSWARLLVPAWPPHLSAGAVSRQPTRPDEWDGVVSIARGQDEWEVTVAGDPASVAARFEEHGSGRVERTPISFREMYLAAMGTKESGEDSP